MHLTPLFPLGRGAGGEGWKSRHPGEGPGLRDEINGSKIFPHCVAYNSHTMRNGNHS
jgi:hypothetical protein